MVWVPSIERVLDARIFFHLTDAIATATTADDLAVTSDLVRVTAMDDIERRALERAVQLRTEALRAAGDASVPRPMRAFEYLYAGITSARTAHELRRFNALAEAHYSGTRRRLLTDAIAMRRGELDRALLLNDTRSVDYPTLPAESP